MRTKQFPLKSTKNYVLIAYYQHKLQCFYQIEMNPITNTIFFLPIQYFLYMELGTKYSKRKLQQFLFSYLESKDSIEYSEEDILEIMSIGLNENDFISFMYHILEQESPLASTSKFSSTYTLQLYELIDSKGQGYITKKDFLQKFGEIAPHLIDCIAKDWFASLDIHHVDKITKPMILSLLQTNNPNAQINQII